MPPTPRQTEILVPGIWAGAVPRIWRTLSCNAYMPYIRSAYRRGAAICIQQQFAAGGGVALGDETVGLAARHRAEPPPVGSGSVFEVLPESIAHEVPTSRPKRYVAHPGRNRCRLP
jgi:hypothetical protein